MSRSFSFRAARLVAVLAFIAVAPGCAIAHLAAVMGQNADYQTRLRVPATYPDLPGKKTAVVVDVDHVILYEHPTLVEQITGGLTLRLAKHVEGVRVLHPDNVTRWQWETPQWNAMPYGEIAEALGVDRVIVVDVLEYRLNPPGNSWLWEGSIVANIGIVEAEYADPDLFAETYMVTSEFPGISGVDRSGATAAQIEMGLLSDFMKRASWLFYEHLEPKYPDKYQPQPGDDM